ncbi:DUF6397 family protein [Streptomyces sp. NPDC050743]|uniref:DUF6397 family protein n=1 Tax=Streptomyces sp. NPDC050743 TaxID=3365634 RepID=UPI0037B19AF0
MRGQLETGVDLRARNWRGRRLGFLLRSGPAPWQPSSRPSRSPTWSGIRTSVPV